MENETLLECMNLLDIALEYYESEKPHSTVTIKNIKDTYKQLSKYKGGFRVGDGLYLKVYQVKLIEKIDKQNTFGSRFNFDIDSLHW